MPDTGLQDTAARAGSTVKSSPHSVPDTVARLSELVAAREMKVFTVIDHSDAAEAVGLQLRDTKVVIFGKPLAGTALMQASPLAALDMPMKVLVWDDDGETRLAYMKPEVFARRYGFDDMIGQLSGINALTDAVIAE